MRMINIMHKYARWALMQSLTEEATDMQDCTMLSHPSLSTTALSLTVGLYLLQI